METSPRALRTIALGTVMVSMLYGVSSGVHAQWSLQGNVTANRIGGNDGAKTTSVTTSGQSPSVTATTELDCTITVVPCPIITSTCTDAQEREEKLSCKDPRCSRGRCKEIKKEEKKDEEKKKSDDEQRDNTGKNDDDREEDDDERDEPTDSNTRCLLRTSLCPPLNPGCESQARSIPVSCNDPRCAFGQCVEEVLKPLEAPKNESDPPKPIELPASTPEPILRTLPALGCFTQDEIWTLDRSQCDTDQKKHFRPIAPVGITGGTMEEAPGTPDGLPPLSNLSLGSEEAFRRRIEQKFIDDAERDRAHQELLASMTNAIERIGSLQKTTLLSTEASAALQETMLWLQEKLGALSIATPSLRQLHEEGQSVEERVAAAQALATSALESAGLQVPRDPATLTEKIERILHAIPEAIALLQEENIVMPPTVLSAYLDAERLYSERKPACVADPRSCVRLGDIIPALEAAIEPIRASIDEAGRPELMERIQELMQQE